MIHNLKLNCPGGHTFAAVSWNDARNTIDDATAALAHGVELIAEGGPPICGVCGSLVFHVEDVVTDYRTMKEAIPALTEMALDEMIERAELARRDDRN